MAPTSADALARLLAAPCSLLALGLVALAVGCGGDDPSSPAALSRSGILVVGPDEPPPFALEILAVPSFGDDRSAVVVDGGRLPARYTCDGEGVAPELTWSGMPDEAYQFALIFEDLDAEPEPYAHWVVTTHRIDRPLTRNALFGEGQSEGGLQGYEPPCPPAGGGPHRFRLTLYWVEGGLGGWARPPTAKELRATFQRFIRAEATLTVTYER